MIFGDCWVKMRRALDGRWPLGRLILALAITCWVADATEMEIELKDNAVQCFYEEIEKGKRCFLEYQVHSPSILIRAHHQLHYTTSP